MKMHFFVFDGMNVVSFISGLVQSFIWGHIVAALLLISLKACQGKCCKSKCCKDRGENCKEGEEKDCCKKEETHKE
jgi:hypothetical protein